MATSDRDKWDARYRARRQQPATREASGWLQAVADDLPRSGTALDVAGGAGRNALWLARRGLDVTVADVSPVGLSLARERAEAEGLTLSTRVVDLASEPLPPGPWDVILSVLFLQRDLFPAMAEALAPGGFLVCLQPTVRNLERHAKPPRPFLLEVGELAELVAPLPLEVVRLDEGWTDDGHHEARLLARRPSRTQLGGPGPQD
jgi:SAM-dependent methyltransferase